MGSPTVLPNTGIQIPANGQSNWQVPLNYDLQIIDNIFGGEQQVPALSVATLTVGTFTITNLYALIASISFQEAPAGAVPGTTYTLSFVPWFIYGFYINGILQRPGVDFTQTENVITLANPTTAGSTLWAVYLVGPTIPH